MHNITYTDIINNSKVRSRTNRQTEAFMCVAANKQQTPNIQQSNRGRARANWDSLYQIIKQNLHWQPAQSRVLSLPRTRTFLYFFKWSLAIVLEAFWGSFRVFLWALVIPKDLLTQPQISVCCVVSPSKIASSEMSQWQSGYQEAIIKEGKHGEETEVCQITQELDWKSVSTGLMEWWIKICHPYVCMEELGRQYWVSTFIFETRFRLCQGLRLYFNHCCWGSCQNCWKNESWKVPSALNLPWNTVCKT